MSLTDKAILELVAAEEAKTIVVLPVDDCEPDPEQPRTQRSEQGVLELAETIKSDGQLQPILVYELGDKFRILMGEGRWLACHHISSRSVEAIIVKKPTAAKILSAQLIENIQREPMHPLDEANAFQRLIALGECKNAAAVAKRIGKSEATVSQAFKLLRVPAPVQELVRAGIARTDAALDLAQILKRDPEVGQQLIDEAKQNGLLERQRTREVKERVEQEAAEGAGGQESGESSAEAKQKAKPKAKPAAGADDQVIAIGKGRLRVKVGIQPGVKGAGTFRAAAKRGGDAMLIADGAHTEEGKVWVEFGDSERHDFDAEDLVILSVFVETRR